MLLIFAPTTDIHALVVAQEVEALGVGVEIVDTRQHGVGAKLTMSVSGDDEIFTWTRADGTAVRLNDAVAAWYRRLPPPSVPYSVRSREVYSFVERQWSVLTAAVLARLPAAAKYNDPRSQGLAANKPYQLAVAREVGLSIPQTVFTNDAASARDMVRRQAPGGTVHKVLDNWGGSFFLTKVWNESNHQSLSALDVAPAIFQQRIAGHGARELRATIIDDTVLVAEVEVPHDLADVRTDLDLVYVPHELPAVEQRRLRALVERLGLRYATVDMRMDAAGNYYFLELNPQGQFLYIEILTGMPIARAVARAMVAPILSS